MTPHNPVAHRSRICTRCDQSARCATASKLHLKETACPLSKWDGPPSLIALVPRAAAEVGAWIKGGARLADSTVKEHRLKTCAACPHWDASAFLGTGRCMHPRCGCSRAKMHLATSACPDGKWPAV